MLKYAQKAVHEIELSYFLFHKVDLCNKRANAEHAYGICRIIFNIYLNRPGKRIDIGSAYGTGIPGFDFGGRVIPKTLKW